MLGKLTEEKQEGRKQLIYVDLDFVFKDLIMKTDVERHMMSVLLMQHNSDQVKVKNSYLVLCPLEDLYHFLN